MQKIKSLVNRRNSQKVPEAPVAPAPVVATVAPVAVAPITSDALLAQKESLSNSSELYRDKNVYNNLVQDAEFGAGRQRLSRGYEAEVLSTGLAGQRLSQTYENTLLNETAYVQGERRASLVRAAPTVLETIEKEVVIQERIHPIEKEEIQPIIYREREQLDVKQITQLMHETQIQPTIVEERELSAEIREPIVERGEPLPQNIVLPTREVGEVSRTQVLHAPIVEETIKRTIIEEIQPVLERDIIQPTVIQNTQTIYEKIIEAPTVSRSIVETRELGIVHNHGDVTLMRELGLENGLNRRSSLLMEQQSAMPLQGQRLSTGFTQQTVYQEQELLQQQQMMQGRRLSQTYVDPASLNGQRLSSGFTQQQLMQQQMMLPTGQVLPQVASSRPAYSYLPQGYAEPRPTFIGTGSQYVLAAGNLPASTFAHTKAMPTVAPQALGMGSTSTAPMFIGRQ